MSRGNRRSSRRNNRKQETAKELPGVAENSEQENSGHEDEEARMTEAAEALRAGLAAISKEIKELKLELRQDLTNFKDELKSEMKLEIANLREEIERKLTENNGELQTQKTRMTEAQARVAELEEWQTEAKEIMIEMANQTHQIGGKMVDLEGRSRRNNVRIFGVPEETEGDSVTKYVEQLLNTELELQEGNVIPQIQRAHRALAQKPPPTATPRSIVVNFLQFDTKEVILKKAWQKKICVGGKRIFFDHDYATEVAQKRKSYLGIKKVLKGKGIRFQTPLAKIRIHWNNGVKTYDDARDAARDMRERGLEVEVPGGAAAPVEERRAQPGWQRVGGKDGGRDSARRAREMLQKWKA